MDQSITDIREEMMKVVMNETTLKILNQIIDNNKITITIKMEIHYQLQK